LPKIRFDNLRSQTKKHLIARARERHITFQEISTLQDWIATGPVAPDDDWFKDFGSFKVAGCGENVRIFLSRGMAPYGKEIK